MKTFNHLVAVFLLVSTAQAWAKSKYPEGVRPLSIENQILRKNPSPDFWKMIPYYKSQDKGNSCSVATMSMVMNALRNVGTLSTEDELVTEPTLLKKTDSTVWSANVGAIGKGMTLAELRVAAEKMLVAYGLKNFSVDLTYASDADARTQFINALKANEKSKDDFIVVNFDQGIVMGESSAGHIAPVGAFDEAGMRVLVLDPDRTWYEPYWVSANKLFDSMNTTDSASKKTRGFIWIKSK